MLLVPIDSLCAIPQTLYYDILFQNMKHSELWLITSKSTAALSPFASNKSTSLLSAQKEYLHVLIALNQLIKHVRNIP